MMEALFFGGLVLVMLLGPWLLVARLNSKRKREYEENEKHWRDAVSRIYGLEQAVQALGTEIRQPTTEKAEPKPSQRSAAAAQISAAHSSAAPPSPGRSVAQPTPSAKAAEAWEIQKAEPAAVSDVPARSLRQTASATPPPLEPTFTASTEAPAYPDQFKSRDLEETVGANWLNKLAS